MEIREHIASEERDELIAGIIDVPKYEAIMLLEAGHLLAQMGRYKEAQELFKGVAALLPHSDVPCVALGNLLFAQGKLNLALKEHEKALKRQPKSSVAMAHMGEIYLYQKKYKEGQEILLRAIRVEPDGLAAKFAQELLKAHEIHLFGD